MWSVVTTTLLSMKIHNVWLSFLNYSSAPHKYSTSDLEEVWLSTEGWCNIKALKLNTSPHQKISLNYVYIFFPFLRTPCFPFFQSLVFPIFPLWRTLFFLFSRALFFRFFPLWRTLFFPVFRGWCSMLCGVVCGHFLSANAPRNRLLLQNTNPTVTIHITHNQLCNFLLCRN